MGKRILFFMLLLMPLIHGQSIRKTRILFILDASNSMNSEWGKQTRIQAAKEVLIQELEALREVENTEAALRIYGHQTPFDKNEQDCNDTKLEVPFAKDNLNAIQLKIKNLVAKGATPIARSLEAAASDFPDTLSKNYIILITDGLESCDNDPCIIAKKLKEKGVKVTPFVIGLGMDMSYLSNFNCIGTYSDAENSESFRKVFNTILNSLLVNTTVQVNLNNIYAKPNETNVTMFFYESGTAKLKYSFVHTLNRKGNPDTLFIDPTLSYDLVVNTLPNVVKKKITLQKHVHNVIEIPTPQGYITLTSPKSIFSPQFTMRISESTSGKTINHQYYDQTVKYLVGRYEAEIFTIPRIYKSLEVSQSNFSNVEIEAPGQLDYSFSKPQIAQLFQLINGTWNLVFTFSDVLLKEKLLIQPGNYKIVYRPKEMKSSGYTGEKMFTISSNKSTALSIN